jgi:hypothetical protein
MKMKLLRSFFLFFTATFVWADQSHPVAATGDPGRDALYGAVPTVISALIFLFVLLFIRFRKRDLARQIALMNAGKEDAGLKLKLKEEQIAKMQSERNEILSDFHLKETELRQKSKELDQLRQEKEALDRQAELYRQKVNVYESITTDKEPDSDTQRVIAEDLKRLLDRQPESFSRDGYIHNLEHLDKSCVEILRRESPENLSVPYLKYCICFAIGMGISDVAGYFCIEPTSVHMIRYRLKKKFGLGNEDDLDLFLRNHAF